MKKLNSVKLFYIITALLVAFSINAQEISGDNPPFKTNITSYNGKLVTQVTVTQSIEVNDLHRLTTLYPTNSEFKFENKDDFRETMSKYFISNEIALDYTLNSAEESLLKKFNKRAYLRWKKSTSVYEDKISAGKHLKRAGRYKNASIAILIGSTATATALISADPSNSSTATIIGAVGALASLGLNVAGNMELIAAGKAIDNKP